MSNVTLIHKKDEITNKNNYRPVSVLPAISKLFEKVIFDQPYASLSSIYEIIHICNAVVDEVKSDHRSQFSNLSKLERRSLKTI